MDDEMEQVAKRNTGPQRGQLAVVDSGGLAGQEVDDRGVLVDIDTPAELEAARGAFAAADGEAQAARS